MFHRLSDAAEHARFAALVHGPLIRTADGIKCLSNVSLVKVAERDSVDAGLRHHQHVDFSKQLLWRQVVDVLRCRLVAAITSTASSLL